MLSIFWGFFLLSFDVLNQSSNCAVPVSVFPRSAVMSSIAIKMASMSWQ